MSLIPKFRFPWLSNITHPGRSPSLLSDGCTERRQKANESGLFVTDEFDKAVQRCKEKVGRLASECELGNRKFRDIEFDLIEDADRCLYGLNHDKVYTPLEARRVSQIFEAPKFIIEGATASDIAQGDLGDCWLLSALAVVACKNLIEQICVARDENAGIYGFIFWRDSGWVDVIIDDILFTKVPKWDSLSTREQMLHHHSRDRYDQLSRRGSKTLYFARSQTENETWVPLIEKAYAKLHGDYASLESGFTSEAVEDLTGAVSTLIYIQDIYNVHKFWKEELMSANEDSTNEDRLFACFIPGLPADANQPDSGIMYPTNGLIPNHAYSIIKAAEFRDKRFLRIRNPWGEMEWKGPWSDGSKEWHGFEEALGKDVLDYKFDQDGEFVMEYEDFRATWGIIEKSRILRGWQLSSQWLQVNAGDFPREWNYGDVSFTINILQPTDAVIVLAQLDTRYFRDLASPYQWSLDFQLYECNNKVPLASSVHSSLWDRSVKAEVKLKAMTYVVHVRLDRKLKAGRSKTWNEDDGWDGRKLARKKVELALSKAIAANIDPLTIPLPLDKFAGKSLAEVEIDALQKLACHKNQSHGPRAPPDQSPASDFNVSHRSPPRDDPKSKETIFPNVPVFSEPDSFVQPEGAQTLQPIRPSRHGSQLSAGSPGPSRYSTALNHSVAESAATQDDLLPENNGKTLPDSKDSRTVHQGSEVDEQTVQKHGFVCMGCAVPIFGSLFYCASPSCGGYTLCKRCYLLYNHPKSHQFLESEPEDSCQTMRSKLDIGPADVNSVVIGLRVYTKTGAAVISGQLRHGDIIKQGEALAFSPKNNQVSPTA